MSKRIVPMSVLLATVVSLAGMSVIAANASIDTSTVSALLYGGRSYVPLKSTASFLGAPLRWDAAKGQAIITYRGQDLALKQNSLQALLAGKPVALSAPPVVVRGVTYVPTDALRKYYNVPVTWDRARSEVKIKGPSGWRTMKANSRPSWHGGPPPWAPAWGRRGYVPPGQSGKVKRSGNGNTKAWGGRGYGAPGHPGNVKPSGSGKAKGNKKDQ